MRRIKILKHLANTTQTRHDLDLIHVYKHLYVFVQDKRLIIGIRLPLSVLFTVVSDYFYRIGVGHIFCKLFFFRTTDELLSTFETTDVYF